MMRAAPTLATAWRDETIARLVKSRQFGVGNLLGQNFYPQQRLVTKLQRRGMFADQSLNRRGRIAVRLVGQVGSQIKANIVLRGAFPEIGREHNMPALPRRPF